MKRTLSILAATLACGCLAPKPSVGIMPWERSEIIGSTLELESTDTVEVFTFSSNGNAVATIGTSQAVSGPVFFWRLDPSGTLVVKDESMRISLKKIRTRGDEVEVLRNEKSATYRIRTNR